jgi:predicted nucleotidyltransferase
MLDAVQRNTGQAPQVLLADAGYRSEAALAQLSGKGVEVIVALGREGKRLADIDANRCPHTAAMAAKLQSQQGQDKYRRRKAIVEPPNAWIKQVLGFRQFSFKGLDKVRNEFKLVCAALNLRRMAAMGA